MFKNLQKEDVDWLVDGELGINSLKLIDIVNSFSNSIFVDIGVETGKSSMILLDNAIEKNNFVFGIDPLKNIRQDILINTNYRFIQDDSVEVGKNWNNGKVSIVFIDSVHVKPQVMRELYYWWDLVKVGGWLVFHDTNWNWKDENGQEHHYVHKHNHRNAGKRPGSKSRGCDTYDGVDWPTPDYAIKEFFNINKLTIKTPHIISEHCPESLGMTFIKKRKDYNFKSYINNWDEIESDRQRVLKYFKR
jgi:hypothetical protein